MGLLRCRSGLHELLQLCSCPGRHASQAAADCIQISPAVDTYHEPGSLLLQLLLPARGGAGIPQLCLALDAKKLGRLPGQHL